MIAVETSDVDIHVRIPRNEVRSEAVEAVLEWLKLESIANRSQMTEDEADAMADEAKASWWRSNRHRFVGSAAS